MFTTDNINHVTSPMHASSKIKARALNMTSNAFVHNRIPQPTEDLKKTPNYEKATEVPDSSFLPTEEDIRSIQRDHLVIIKRTLVKYMKYFQSIRRKGFVEWYIPHKYSEESAKKSEVLPMGILDINQATIDGTKTILKYISNYIPNNGDRKLPMLVGGDALSIRNMTNTIYHLCNSGPEDEKLEGICPAVGQFHTRVDTKCSF
jgi:hypothetical protein